MKGVKIFALFMIFTLAMVSAVSALPVTIDMVKINGDEVSAGENLFYERGEELEIRVRMEATQDIENVELRAFIAGYEYSDHEQTSDSDHISNFNAGSVYTKELSITLPDKLDQDSYTLRLYLADRDGTASEFTYNLIVGTKRHQLDIKDVVLSPEGKVSQGRTLLATIRVKNTGEKDEDGLKIKVAIPELGISASQYIDELEAEDTKTSEELLLRIPKCAEAKEYKLVASVVYDEGYETVSEESTIRVQDSGVCEVSAASSSTTNTPKTIITVGPEVQDVVKGKGGAIYPLTLSNADSTSKTFTISAEAGNWASIKISPSNVVVLGPNEAKAVYVYVSAKEEASAGQQMFALKIKSGDATLKEIALKANVVEPVATSNVSSLRNALQIGLVVLVVLLVVIGLIIGFNRLKADEDDEDLDAGQTYY